MNVSKNILLKSQEGNNNSIKKMETPSVLFLIIEYFKKHPLQIIPYIVFVLLYPISDVLLPHFYGKTMDAIKAHKPLMKYMWTIVAVMTFIQLSKLAYDKLDSYIFPKLKTFIMTRMFERILQRYENDFQELKTGDIISRFARTPEIIARLFHRTITRILPFLLTLIFSVVYFTLFDKVIAVCFLLVMTVVLYIAYRGVSKCHCFAKTLDKSFNSFQEEVDDALRNLYSIYGSRQQQSEVDRITDVSKPFLEGHKETMQCTINMRSYSLPFIFLFLCFFLVRSSIKVRSGQISPGLFITFFVIILYNVGNLFIFNDSIRDIVTDWGALECISELLRTKQTLLQMSITKSTRSSGIELKDVTFTYPGSTSPTLKDYNLIVDKGEKVAIVGEIGAGKSTILKLLMKYLNPDSGDIFIDSKNYNDITLAELRTKVGYIPQQPTLFNRSVYENITYGITPRPAKEDVEQVLRTLNVWDEFEKLQDGLDTNIGKNGSKVSGGQKQLIWCLRVLFSSPEYLIMDEPTSSVNEDIKTKLRNIINKVMAGKTVIMVTHDKYLMQYADRIIKL